MSLPVAGEAGEAFAELSRMRGEFYACLTVRGDELFELTDAMLCAQGAVRSIPELTLTPEHRRGHGALYDGLNAGRIDVDRLRNLLSRTKLPRFPEGRLVLAVDVSAWLRSDAACSPDRLFCHVYGRAKSASQFIPGWPYSFVAVLEPGASSWTQILDAVRLGPEDDATAVTAAQLRQVVQRLIAAGQWRDGDPDILIVADAGYDVCRLGWVLADLPVELVGRLRSDRVMQLPKPVRAPGTNGRPPKHGPQFRFTDPGSWPEPAVTTITATSNYGKALTQAWDRVHPRLTHRSAWLGHDGALPVIEGTLIRLEVAHLSRDRDAPPVWLWSSKTGAAGTDVDRAWQAFLRRFDLEHTFRLFKQTLSWTRPRLREPEAADRWTWLLITAHTQLRLARPLTADLRHSWEKPAAPAQLTPARVRRWFRNLRPALACPARAPKPSRPGPGRPSGQRNRHRATRYDVGKTVKRPNRLPAGHALARPERVTRG
ncbi:NF041680 family putative transposase [Nocardia australiensis]|uniref:NF041680 family putative transposase n=1 Tax=Nocardia australiensis TaxID=2887191 RepID=UPI001D135303|nr:NF041680 family putative transposase [Nocardia australiensis]